MKSEKLLQENEEKKACLISDTLDGEVLVQRALIGRAEKAPLREDELSDAEKKAIAKLAKKRGAASSTFRMIEKEDVVYTLTELGNETKNELLKANITGEEFGLLTPQMIQSGSWKKGTFRPYGLNAPVSRLIPGRTNAYADYLQWVKDKLVSLGFEEFDGPLVVNEFWNGDALFMPQFHSARDIHDVYYVKEPRHCREIEEPWLSRVAATHENGGDTGSRGWGYAFDHEFTRRQVMRSQGTVLSATQLPHAKVPGKYFGVADDAVCHALSSYEPHNNRSQLVEAGGNRFVIDAYNANPTSMAAALDNFRMIEAVHKMVILGDMKELGEASVEEHQKIADMLTTCGFDRVILVGPEFGKTENSYEHFNNADEVYAALSGDMPKGYMILIKGSNSMKLASLAEKLMKSYGDTSVSH